MSLKKDSRRCVFFDRDGIVNEPPGPPGYILRQADFRLIPAFVDSLRVVKRHGYQAAIVTNQRCVARGLLSTDMLEDIHRKLTERLAEEQLSLLDIAYCPHDENQCLCRKPQPGMLLELARKHGLDLAGSWMIGDSPTDVEAGKRAGCRTILVGCKTAEATEGSGADIILQTMAELPAALELAFVRQAKTQES